MRVFAVMLVGVCVALVGCESDGGGERDVIADYVTDLVTLANQFIAGDIAGEDYMVAYDAIFQDIDGMADGPELFAAYLDQVVFAIEDDISTADISAVQCVVFGNVTTGAAGQCSPWLSSATALHNRIQSFPPKAVNPSGIVYLKNRDSFLGVIRGTTAYDMILHRYTYGTIDTAQYNAAVLTLSQSNPYQSIKALVDTAGIVSDGWDWLQKGIVQTFLDASQAGQLSTGQKGSGSTTVDVTGTWSGSVDGPRSAVVTLSSSGGASFVPGWNGPDGDNYLPMSGSYTVVGNMVTMTFIGEGSGNTVVFVGTVDGNTMSGDGFSLTR